MSRAALSIDVDSVSSHLSGYGLSGGGDDDSVYCAAIPRILGMLERTGARSTFFLIADEARRFPDIVRQIADAGHEVASHSMTHPLPFASLDDEALRLELSGSKVILRELSNQPVIGFRAPSWDAGETLIDGLIDAGYTYDSSSYPSYLLPLMRAAIAKRSVDGMRQPRHVLWREAFGPTRPIRIERDGRGLIRVPMCTTPIARLPYYHTLRFVAPAPVFGAVRALAHARKHVWYQFHAVDFLGAEEDDLDSRITRHPGMDMRLDEKLALAEREVRILGTRGAVVPLRNLVTELFGVVGPPSERINGVPR